MGYQPIYVVGICIISKDYLGYKRHLLCKNIFLVKGISRKLTVNVQVLHSEKKIPSCFYTTQHSILFFCQQNLLGIQIRTPI